MIYGDEGVSLPPLFGFTQASRINAGITGQNDAGLTTGHGSYMPDGVGADEFLAPPGEWNLSGTNHGNSMYNGAAAGLDARDAADAVTAAADQQASAAMTSSILANETAANSAAAATDASGGDGGDDDPLMLLILRPSFDRSRVKGLAPSLPTDGALPRSLAQIWPHYGAFWRHLLWRLWRLYGAFVAPLAHLSLPMQTSSYNDAFGGLPIPII
jgi:hypothetical protein